MAGTDAKVGVPGTSDNMEGVAVTTTAGANLFREGVVVSDPVIADARARVLDSTPSASDYGQVVRVAGTASVAPVVLISTLNSTTSPLAGGATYTGTFEDLNGYAAISILVNADSLASSNALKVDFSTNGTDVDRTVNVDIVTGGDFIALPCEGRFYRVRLTAGGSAQSILRLQTKLSAVANGLKMTPLIDVLDDSSSVLDTRGVIVGKTTAGGGGYVAVKVNPSGALTADVSGSTVAITEATVTGTWGYRSGTSGTPSIPAGAKVLNISAISPSGAASSFTINGGNTITVPASQNFTLSPRGNLVAPTIVFSGTDSYLVEYVT